MTRQRDPLGKRALFSEAGAERRRPDEGREERPAAPDPLSLTVTVHCSACDESTTLSAVGFAVQHIPFWMWVPWKRHSHLMRCPSCGKLAWHSATLG